jgi:4'-phosphopantetheinyl transferase
MNIEWFEQTEADVPSNDDWLGVTERSTLSGLTVMKRRMDWRLGRWTAKLAFAAHAHLPADPDVLRDVEILPAPSGAPRVFLEGRPAGVTISLSHRAGVAACCVAAQRAALGCDLERIEPHSDAFVAAFFTPGEQELINEAPVGERRLVVSLLWSAKESALKALNVGLREDTCWVVVSPFESPGSFTSLVTGWRPLIASCGSGLRLRGWWREGAGFVRTVAAAPPPSQPVLLSVDVHAIPFAKLEMALDPDAKGTHKSQT